MIASATSKRVSNGVFSDSTPEYLNKNFVMKPSQWYQAEGFRHVDGHRLFLHQAGEGPALLCLHGMAGASWSWHKLAPSLEERFQVLAPDLLGFGQSERPPEARYSIVAHSDRLELLLAELGIQRFHVLGQGIGAMVGIELMARAEGRLREGRDPRIDPASLFLVNPPMFAEFSQPPRAERLLAMQFGEFFQYVGTKNLFWDYLNQLSGPYSRPTPQEVSYLWRMMTRDGGRYIWSAHARYHRELMKRGRRWIKALQDTERPFQIAAGPEDPIAGHRLEAAFRRALPEKKRIMVGKLGHAPHFEAADKLLPLIDDFYREITA